MWWADAAWERAGWDQADLLSVLIVSDSPRVPLTPLLPHATTPYFAETQHNHVMKTLRLALPVSPYLLVLRFARFLSPYLLLQCPHTLFLCTLSSVVTPRHLMLFYRLTVYMRRLLCNAVSFLDPGFWTLTALTLSLPDSDSVLSSCFWMLCVLCSFLCTSPPSTLSAIQSVTVM